MDGFGQPLEEQPASTPTLEALFRRYHRWLTAMLQRRYGHAEAEDLMQETYLRMARADGAEPIKHPRALLMRIARNAATDRHRRTWREAQATVQAPDMSVFPTAAVQHQAVLIKQIVLALPPKLRDVFVLNQMEGLSHPEIARHLGIHVKTVEWRMRKALALCAAAVKE